MRREQAKRDAKLAQWWQRQDAAEVARGVAEVNAAFDSGIPMSFPIVENEE